MNNDHGPWGKCQFAEKLEQNPFGSLHDLIIEALAKGIWIKLSPSPQVENYSTIWI